MNTTQQTGDDYQWPSARDEAGPELTRQLALLAKLAKANSTSEVLELIRETLRLIGVEIAGVRHVNAERTIEIMVGDLAGVAGGEGRTIEVSADSSGNDDNNSRLQVICAHVPTPERELEIEAVARVGVLRAELCERRLWGGGDKEAACEAPTRTGAPHLTVTGMVLASEESRALEREIIRAASSPHSVLITGETGTGKTTAARAIHDLSDRRGRAFVEINCAAIPESLLEAELFGFERGAFTGAVGSKRGQFEEADGGTLFLDEVGELTPAMQAKLLKAIEEKTVRRLGAVRAVKCDVRLLAATSQNLTAMIREGRFREDLYYRLEVLEILMTPLRERRADIALLVGRCLKKEQKSIRRERPPAIEEAAMDALCNYSWPGNIRQLQNVIAKLAAYLADESVSITAEDVRRVLRRQQRSGEAAAHSLAPAGGGGGPLHLIENPGGGEISLPPEILHLWEHETLKRYLARVKVCAIETARKQANGNMFDAARRLGVAYPTLNQGLKKARRNAA